MSKNDNKKYHFFVKKITTHNKIYDMYLLIFDNLLIMTGFDMKKWNRRKLKELKEGKYMGMTKYRYDEGASIKTHKLRHRKFYVPKWIWKVKYEPLRSECIDFHEKHGRFPNNEERILARVKPFSYNPIKEVSKDTCIDYRNISRYLKRMEKKGLIKTEPHESIKTMKSGRLKTYHTKNIKIAKKGRNLYNKIFGRS